MSEKRKDIKSIFSEAIEKQTSEEREDYLKKVCVNNAELRERVENLIRAHNKAGDFLEVPAVEPGITSSKAISIEGPGTKIGRYKLLELIGEGGMGLVYLAEQAEPVKRRVALKVIKPGMDSKEVIARFESERQALALLDHPNIAHVFDAGTTTTGRPYFVMEYVKGMSITRYCDEHRLNIEQRLKLFREVCEGVHHAHQKGIIHRDIKPSNILISLHGDRAVPKIIDFGIAKAAVSTLTEKTIFTFHGQLLGTPEYMSPEQVDLATQDIDTRSDIYSLGVVLYELLTGVLPFEIESLHKIGLAELQRTIRELEPASPSIRLSNLGQQAKAIADNRMTQVVPLARRLHRELEWIPLKAMRKDRCRRYKSASDMADDIQSYLNGNPLLAGPETAMYRVQKFVHKHAGSVATAALLLVVIVIGLIVSIVMGCRAEQARRQEAITRAQAEDQAEKYRRLLYTHSIALADVAYHNADIPLINELLSSCPEDLRGWEWTYLNHVRDQSYKTLRGHVGTISTIEISPDGKRIISCGLDKTIKMWDSHSGEELMTLLGQESQVNAAFSPDGRQIISGAYDGIIKVWDIETTKELMTLTGHEGAAGAFFNPDGKTIVSGSIDKTLRIWDAKTGAELKTLRGHEEPVTCHTISPDGSLIASGSYDQTVIIWDATTGAELMVLRGHEDTIRAIAFSPDSNRIISSANKNIKLWNANTGTELMTLRGHGALIYSVAWSPDGKHIVSTGEDKTIRVWDATSGAELRILRGHESLVSCVRFYPANGQLISCGYDETIKIWDPIINYEQMQIGDREWQRGGDFSPDGQRIVSGDNNGIITIWDRSTGTELITMANPEKSAVADVKFSPDGKRIFSSQGSGTLWDATTGVKLMSFGLPAGSGTTYGIFSPDGGYIASWIVEYGENNYIDAIKLRDTTTGEEIMSLEGHEADILAMAFSPDSKRLASGDNNGTIKIWDVEAGKNAMTIKLDNGVSSIAFSPNGAHIASGNNDGTIRLWDVETGSEIMNLKGHNLWILSLAFSLDGKRLVSTSRDRIVKLWDTLTGKEVLSRTQFRGTATFSPNGKAIAITGGHGIALLESEVPTDGYRAWRNGAAAREAVKKLHEELGLYSKVIEELKSDKTLDESVCKLALQIAYARLWEDEEKTEE